jgi:ATP-dependent exoDNAse (exonuclease V) beta subunit
MSALEYVEDIASELKQNLSAPDTGKIYLRAIVKTWQLIQQLARLIFLLALLFIAFVIWVWNLGFKSGHKLRKQLETEQTSPQSLLQQAINLLVSLLKGIVDWAESQISQLPSEQTKIQVIPPAPANNSTNLITPAKNQTTTIE